jgi:hypothetical protein
MRSAEAGPEFEARPSGHLFDGDIWTEILSRRSRREPSEVGGLHFREDDRTRNMRHDPQASPE